MIEESLFVEEWWLFVSGGVRSACCGSTMFLRDASERQDSISGARRLACGVCGMAIDQWNPLREIKEVR